MKHFVLPFFYASVLLSVFPHSAFAQCTWNGTTGTWSDGTKWSCGHAPLAAENAVVNAGTITLDVAPVITNLTLNGGTITGVNDLTINGNLTMATNTSTLGNTGDVTVAGTFAWAIGTIGSSDGTATGTVTVAGVTTITTSSIKSLYKKTLNLNSGANYSGNGIFSFRYSSVLNIPAGQTFAVDASASVFWLASIGGGTLNNAGTFDKQGSGALTIAFDFDNSGAITGAGAITFSGTFTNSGMISPGNSPGILNLNKSAPGLAVQNLAIELQGPNPGAGGYDQLNNSSGAINLNNGTLTVTLLNAYLPGVGTSFIIATGTSRTGTFGTLNLPVDNARWTVNYNFNNVTITVAAPLPVELIDFQAIKTDRQVRLTWATASEHDNRGFGIERSGNGRAFENIGFVDGNGDSSARIEYTFDDSAPLHTRTAYYRLRQEDFAGKIQYSAIRSVSGTSLDGASIWPNPVVNGAVLNFDLPIESVVTATVTDMQGRVLRQLFSTELPKGEHQIELPEIEAPAGRYLLQLKSGATVQIISFLKQ